VIQRADRKRSIRVTADIDKSNPDANANEVVTTLTNETLAELPKLFPGTTWNFQGEQRDQRNAMEELQFYGLLALLAIYILLAIPLRSYTQPIIVMAVIPFGIIGAVAGHVLLGLELSIMSMCGIVALAGMVVNDSLVLVDYVNRMRAKGEACTRPPCKPGGNVSAPCF
jgi:multidrug efflux pump subunit AcrB